MTFINRLEPSSVWRHFAEICAIPRPSLSEAALRDHIASWAGARGLAVHADAVGNLLIRKPASRGRENRPGVVLQAHLDMVCQANSGVAHDFLRDPIVAVERDGWLVAEETTLGADNGIGVALALAALEDETLAHPDLEVLLTVDEEAGMGGAHGLEAGLLRGTRMLNLDTEEWGEFYLGCAGGCDVTVSRHCHTEMVPSDYRFRRITVAGLVGGHSGGDIHLGRGNANKMLVRVLRQLEKSFDFRLCAFSGGTARNALAREAWAVIALPPGTDEEAVEAVLRDAGTLYRDELAGVDDGVCLSMEPAEESPAVGLADQSDLMAALHAAPHGVRRMSVAFPDIVETSNNLGVMALADGRFSANLMVRSLRGSGTRMLADEISSLFALAGCRVEVSGEYPGWTPDAGSALLALCQDVFRREFGRDPSVKIIHAGLECGVIGSKYPGLDMVSLGPTIRGAHAPGERVDIATVAECWKLLGALLAAL
ncbi:MAG: aminoacyl-histidine dipeptidase [Telmatospirillum sp.]|nr:aminoacyl-histidine dipeptidase [Telmatospirillum sp.]